jgi:predicted glycogen debranching enzyme
MTDAAAFEADPLDAIVRRIAHPADPEPAAAADMLRREWLVTNGLGGYASGTVTGGITRRFHGVLIAALPAPLGRCMLLPLVVERLRLADGRVVWLGPYGEQGQLTQDVGAEHLTEFRLEAGMPIWRYEAGDCRLEKSLVMPHGQNTVHITWRLLEGPDAGVRLALRPLLGFRPHQAPVDQVPVEGYTLTARDRRIEIHGVPDMPPLRLVLEAAGGGAFTVDDQAVADVRYLLEEHRGYDHAGPLWSPGYFRAPLRRDDPVTLIASIESWETIGALRPAEAWAAERARRRMLLASAHPAARQGPAGELTLAADQLVIRPAARSEDAARAEAGGREARTIIAGYHWFTDWGRDTMIALEGLTLVTGRYADARAILQMFASHVRDGLIPNLFPEGEHEGLYHTADATLWFFHALDRYLAYSPDDHALLEELLPVLRTIVARHLEGTRFGIRVDPEDGLLTQGAEGYQLTWMDAKVDGWVVTPRRGKAVEINALWYNALRLLEGWLRDGGDAPGAADVAVDADRAYAAFNRRFWRADGEGLYDVVDGEEGDDPACRPNQILAVSLPRPVLAADRHAAVVGVVQRQLLTPYGLRSLAPGHADYKTRYFGDLRSRDAAYHQGTVWSWLMGPFVDAWLATWPDDAEGARRVVAPMLSHLDQACVGSVSEIFDAEGAYTPRGCVAQAWGVAEWLRVLIRTHVPTSDPGAHPVSPVGVRASDHARK